MKTLLAPLRYPNMKFLQPVGLSGGITLLWKNGFICDVVSCENNMIHVAVQCDPSQLELLLSCMYGYCDYSKKKTQWEFIKDIGLNISQPWVLLGDLNFHILDTSSSVSSSGDGLVNSIIQEVGLQVLGFVGREHNWSNNNMGIGIKRSRLDMDFLNGSWNSHFQDSKFLHLQQSGSDHCPIITCAAEIAKAWEKSVQGSPGYRLIKRLQFTRITLSKWNKTHFGNIDQNVDNLQHKLSEIQALPFSPDNTSKAIEVSRELDKWYKNQHEFYKQKSRDNFVNDMDYNTKYFHTLTKGKRARNNIDSLKPEDGSWLQSREDISVLLSKHFKNISTSQNPTIEEQHYIHIPTLITEEDNMLLLIPPTDEEIHKILKSMERWSAPGPEGFQAGFYKSQWSIVGNDVCEMRKEGEGGWLALNLDMSKAFDSLEWSFLLKVLQSFGFCEDWCQLIKQCISTTSLFVMLNGSPCEEFSPTRGIRQRDPLSP
ncbi:uncharacterized protein LOC113312767 [Papaver somniferum]|uniref:uncharacterized protein LOC113312767 n=1 Tax=Papaver somniferum TaxID=3469 RepID=UPI000E700720|nr:uncharacterized protein LOC113312767 [Papaver somniferum]